VFAYVVEGLLQLEPLVSQHRFQELICRPVEGELRKAAVCRWREERQTERASLLNLIDKLRKTLGKLNLDLR
jgi:hypothetical protein